MFSTLLAVLLALVDGLGTSKCMHGMNQTEAEYPRHNKRSWTASLNSISPVVFAILAEYLLRMRKIGHVT